jgi:hypothetical protein
MQIDESDEHHENAQREMRESLVPDWNVTVNRRLHPKKQSRESFPTDAGMQIDESDAHWENGLCASEVSRDANSSAIAEKDGQR